MSFHDYQNWLWRKMEEFERAPGRFGMQRCPMQMAMDLMMSLAEENEIVHVKITKKRKGKKS